MKSTNSAFCGNARLKGPLGKRLGAIIANHVAATDVDYITAPFMEKTETKGWWQTEFWGKWMHSAVPYLEYERGGSGAGASTSALLEKIRRGVERILSSQEESGYIGNYPEEIRCGEGWDVWGMKYTLLGLIHFHDMVEGRKADGHETDSGLEALSARALEAAKRLCDYAIGELGPGGRRGVALWQTGYWCGMASSSILEPVVWLYNRTGEGRYFDFASYIVEGIRDAEAGPRLIDLALNGVPVADRNGYGNEAETGGGYALKHNRWKAYEMMSCYQGLLEYVDAARAGGAVAESACAELERAAVMAAENIADEEVNLAGGCSLSEAWCHGARHQFEPGMFPQETCVTTTWMRLCEKLLDRTGDPKWADRIERTFYNAYLGAMKADGSEFAGYTPLSGWRYHGQHHCFMHTDCCTANGPRGFLCLLRKFFTTGGDTATFNFYASANADGVLDDGRRVAFEMYSLYPRGDTARIVSHTQCAGEVALRLRIPVWSGRAEVTLNGEAVDGVKAGTYLTVRREWKLGDIVEIRFGMEAVAHTIGRNVAFTRGPVLLARDSRFDDGDISETFRYQSFRDGDTVETLDGEISPDADIWMAFSARMPLGPHRANPEGSLPETVHFCDYASAGNRWSRRNYYRTWFQMERSPYDRDEA